MLVNIKWLNACLLLILLNSSTFASQHDEDDKINNLVDNFLINLVDKDEKNIIENFLNSPEYYAKEKKLNEDIYNFLYRRDINKSKKAITDIILKEDIAKKIIWQKDNIFTLIAFRNKNRSKADSDIEFLKKEWMKEYIACEFIIKDGKIFLYKNFCFFETDGPFHDGLR